MEQSTDIILEQLEQWNDGMIERGKSGRVDWYKVDVSILLYYYIIILLYYYVIIIL